MNAIITEALTLLRAALPTNIVIRQDVPETALVVMGDSTQLHQVIINLCANAAHAIEPKAGVLKVKLQRTRLDSNAADNLVLEPGPYVTLTVSDTGHGIAPAVRERIFDPYFTTKSPGKGTGMGLAVVHGIVKSHGGAIDVFSEPNVKTEFRVFLPISDAEVTCASEVKKDTLPTGQERVLLVDDEEMMVDVLGKMVAQLGYDVDSATDSCEALEMFREDPKRYDLVITDMTMPNLTGKQLAAEMKLLRPEIPIVLCSGFNDDCSLAEARELGIAEFAMKPLGMQQLAQIIRDVLDRRELERRGSQRVRVANGAFVISRSNPANRRALLDISLSGLAYVCDDAAEDLGRVEKMNICMADHACAVDDLSCKTVSDGGAVHSADPLGDADRIGDAHRRRGVQFQELTATQLDQLRYFIQNNAGEVSH